MKMKVHKNALIAFFDTDRKTNKSHSSSINAICGEDLAIGLLQHYFEGKSKICTNLSASPQIGVPKEDRKGGGRWLDGWLLVKDEKDSPGDLYQVEVKSWSAHSLGGRELAVTAHREELCDFKSWYWNMRWNRDSRRFNEDSVNKVFLTMKRPPGYANANVKHLVCFWAALSPNPKEEVEDYFFSMQAREGEKEMEFHVFSLSGYLRTLPDETIDLQLPNVEKRLDVLRGIFPGIPAAVSAFAASQ